MATTDLLGYAAGFLTTAAFVPQVRKTLRTRSAGDLSWGMLVIFLTGVFFWFLYGLALRAWPIVLFNVLTFVLNVVIVVVKLRGGPSPAPAG